MQLNLLVVGPPGDVYDLLDNLPVHDVASILMAYLTLVDVMKRTSS